MRGCSSVCGVLIMVRSVMQNRVFLGRDVIRFAALDNLPG